MLCCGVLCSCCSFANGRAWVLDTSSSTWKGYKLSFTEPAKAKAKVPVDAAPAANAAAEAVLEADKESCPIAVE